VKMACCVLEAGTVGEGKERDWMKEDWEQLNVNGSLEN